MGSLLSAWLRFQIRLVKPVLNHLDVKSSRIAQDKLGNISQHVMANKVAYLPVDGYDEEIACWALPHEQKADGFILYLHGGSYVAGSLQYSKLFGGILASECRKSVFCLGYSLAPEHPFPAGLDDAYAAYMYLLSRGTKPEQIAIVGESAGGGLSFCLLHKLIEEQQPIPACVVSLSPWMDLTLSGQSYDYNKKKDITLTREQLAHYADFYAPTDKKNKFVSPAYGDFDGFPPGLVIAGGNEILLEDACLAEHRYHEAKGHCQLIIEPKMWHAYPLYGTPESKAAISKISRFIDEHIEHQGKD